MCLAQPLGNSRSSYCLRDQLQLNSELVSSWEALEAFLSRLRSQWSMRFMTDLVYNHTANDTPWLEVRTWSLFCSDFCCTCSDSTWQSHPESVYNLVNSPHLRPAYLLDRLVWNLSVDSQKEVDGLVRAPTNEEHLDTLAATMRHRVALLQLHEFYQCHVDNTIDTFRAYMASTDAPSIDPSQSEELHLILDPQYRRLHATVDMATARWLFMKVGKMWCVLWHTPMKPIIHSAFSHKHFLLSASMAHLRFAFLSPANFFLGRFFF